MSSPFSKTARWRAKDVDGDDDASCCCCVVVDSTTDANDRSDGKEAEDGE